MAIYSSTLCLLLGAFLFVHGETTHPNGDDSCFDTADRDETFNGNVHLLQVGLSMEKKPNSISSLDTGMEKIRATALDTLSRCSGHLSGKSPVVATLLDSTYAHLALPWATRVRQLGYSDMVIACLDDETFANVSSLFASESDVCVVPFNAPRKSSARLPSMAGQAKFDILATLTKAGRECIVSEGDVFWSGSPADMLHRFGQTKSLAAAPPANRRGLNIGFVYARPTEYATSFLQDVARNWSQVLVNNQSQGQALMADQLWFNEQLLQQPSDLWGNLALLRGGLDCQSPIQHLNGEWLRPKVDLLNDLYAGVLTCSDLLPLRSLGRWPAAWRHVRQ